MGQPACSLFFQRLSLCSRERCCLSPILTCQRSRSPLKLVILYYLVGGGQAFNLQGCGHWLLSLEPSDGLQEYLSFLFIASRVGRSVGFGIWPSDPAGFACVMPDVPSSSVVSGMSDEQHSLGGCALRIWLE